MPRQSDEIIKGFIGQVGILIDARLKTFEVNLKAYVGDAIKSSEERIRKDMATKDDIKQAEERIRKDMATKDDIKRLEQKIDKTSELEHQLSELKKRVEILEEYPRVQN